MKRTLPTWLGVLCAVAAFCGIIFGIAANHQKNIAEQNAIVLQKQLAATLAQKPLITAPPTIRKTSSSNNDDDNNTALLTAQLAQQEAELVHLRKELDKKKPKVRESWNERMARIKKEDPETYAKIIEHRAERQQAMRYTLAQRTATIVDLDTSFMTDEELANHELLLEKMSNIWKFTEQFQDPEQAPNRESMHELFGAINETRPLLDTERNAMFQQLAHDIGYEAEDAAAFADYADKIIQATTIQMPSHKIDHRKK